MLFDNDLNPVLGIDLGTTFSAIARWDGHGPRVYQTRTGEDTLQSVVYLDPKTNELLVGKVAFRRGLIYPENMAIGIKRYMDDASQKIVLAGQAFSPIELSARILERLYKDVAEKCPTNLFRSRATVVTVPYYFKAHQCENTSKAAELANINCIGLIQEPIAASLAYAWQIVQSSNAKKFAENILVFDLGGGTFDLTLFRLEKSPEKLLFEVLATGGDDRLGGMDFDECLFQFLLEKADLTLDGLTDLEERKARQKILEQVIEAKHTLSATQTEYITVTDVIPGRHIDTIVTRSEFEGCIQTYIDKIERVMERLWATTNMQPQQVDRVILVGGSSKIPCIKSLVSDIIGAAKVYQNTNPWLCVAEGAAIYAAYLDNPEVFGRNIEIRTRTSHALGVEIKEKEFYPLIAANRKTPCQQTQVFSTTSDYQTSLDINIYQGCDASVKNNTFIGTIGIYDLPKRPQGELDIWVTFNVNESQMLSVIVEVEGIRKAATLKFA